MDPVGYDPYSKQSAEHHGLPAYKWPDSSIGSYAIVIIITLSAWCFIVCCVLPCWCGNMQKNMEEKMKEAEMAANAS